MAGYKFIVSHSKSTYNRFTITCPTLKLRLCLGVKGPIHGKIHSHTHTHTHLDEAFDTVSMQSTNIEELFKL